MADNRSENCVIKTEYGAITLTREAIGQVIMKVLRNYQGRVHVSNHRGRLLGLRDRLSRVDEIDNMEIRFDESGIVSVRIYIVMRFGLSISRITGMMIREIHDALTRVMGKEPAEICIVVAGVLSKNLVPRHIEISRRYDEKPKKKPPQPAPQTPQQH
ncbi:MAG: Asp23/Gls24 family envelope stress response protein [Anaerovoracaceae bacterium]|jgi:uncharacterized alkaline shock family protein YloU